MSHYANFRNIQLINIDTRDIRPSSENIHTKGAHTWMPQKENKAEWRVLFSNKHILVRTICNSMEIY
jgi:hypothetical protein